MSPSVIAHDRFRGAPRCCPAKPTSDGGIATLHLGMIRPELARALVTAGAHHRNDPQVEEANTLFDLDRLARDRPGEIEDLAPRHDRNKIPDYWRELHRPLAANLTASPAYTPADLTRIPIPTLLITGRATREATLTRW